MGLFDSLAGAMLSKVGGNQGAMAQMAVDLFNQHGGLVGIVEKFKAGGFDQHVASWIGSGENLPISAEQINAVLDNGEIAAMAARLGVDASDVSNKIAEYLPQLIDKMTPDGQINQNPGSVFSALLGLLK